MSILIERTALALFAIAPLIAWSQESASDEISSERAARLAVMQKIVGEYSMTIGSSEEMVTLRESPVLRFSNPIRLAADGGMFLWEHDGRPVALTCVFPSGVGLWDHEFQSLSDRPLVARRGIRTVWSPAAAIRFTDVPKASAPPFTAPARRREMGTISRRFTARMLGWGEGKRKDDELRMLASPIHRWGDPKGEVVDGGMFLFGEATDPEVALVLEAHRVEEVLIWKYALARVTTAELAVRIDNEIVWSIPPWDFQSRPNEPYLTIFKQLAPKLK